jgi:hypothetical protein
MPPLATITADARNSNSPTVFRDDATPSAAVVGSNTAPRTPTTAPFSTISSSTRWRCANRTFVLPSSRRAKMSTIAGPVPQVMWKRGTELPWPRAS